MNNQKQTPSQYLHDLLTQIEPYSPTSDDEKSFSRDKVDYIFRKIDRKKFRRKKLGEESKNAIREKIRLSVDSNRPIHLVIPFGGYKHYWNPSHPEPDWAELFNFRYITEYVMPILALYEPGVVMEYMSEDMILPRMNNYPPEAIEKYIEVFKQLIEWYQNQVPSNLQIKFFRVSDRCKKEEIIRDVEELLPERRVEFNKLSDDEKEIELKRSYRSILWGGMKDLTDLSDQERQEKIIESRLIELAYYDTEAKPEYIGNYLSEDNHICICFSFGLSPDNAFDDLTLGSTFGSIVDYWIGRGVLGYTYRHFHPRIISAKQDESNDGNLTKYPIDLDLPGNNYTAIEVLKEESSE